MYTELAAARTVGTSVRSDAMQQHAVNLDGNCSLHRLCTGTEFIRRCSWWMKHATYVVLVVGVVVVVGVVIGVVVCVLVGLDVGVVVVVAVVVCVLVNEVVCEEVGVVVVVGVEVCDVVAELVGVVVGVVRLHCRKEPSEYACTAQLMAAAASSHVLGEPKNVPWMQPSECLIVSLADGPVASSITKFRSAVKSAHVASSDGLKRFSSPSATHWIAMGSSAPSLWQPTSTRWIHRAAAWQSFVDAMERSGVPYFSWHRISGAGLVVVGVVVGVVVAVLVAVVVGVVRAQFWNPPAA